MAPKRSSTNQSTSKDNAEGAKVGNKENKSPARVRDPKTNGRRLLRVPFHSSPNAEDTGNKSGDFTPYCIDASGYENDPVEKEWAIILNPPPDNRRVVVLRYPHRGSGDPYLARKGQKPMEIRIKPRSGLVEVDVPLHIHQKTYDKHRGLMYGGAMRRSEIIQAGGSFGVRGGLGNATTTNKRPVGQRVPSLGAEPSEDDLLDDFEQASADGHVMNKITLAGVVAPWEEIDPVYFLAIFKQSRTATDGKLESYVYLTKVDAIVELNPILDHVDALRDNEKVTSTRGVRRTGDQADEVEARAVNLTVKATDEEGEEMETLGERSAIIKAMNAMRDEPWQRLEYHDSETLEAWDQYDGTLTQPHPEALPKLVSSMSNEQWMDAISAPRDDPTRLTNRAMGLPKKARSMKGGARHPGSKDLKVTGGDGKGSQEDVTGAGQADDGLEVDVDTSGRESEEEEPMGVEASEESDGES